MTEMSSGRSYQLPSETLPGENIESNLGRLVRFEELCHAMGVSTTGTRVERYRRYLQWRSASDAPLDALDSGIFVDPDGTPVQHGLDRFLYILRETHELGWIGEGLRQSPPPGLAIKLSTVVGGADLAALDRNSASRNAQFELRIASYFSRAGYSVDLSTLTDVVAERSGLTYHVECKRVASEKQIARRIKEAVSQLRLRMPRSSLTRGHYGVVAVDVTKVAFAHNGLTWGVTPDHARDVLQDKLRLVSGFIDRTTSGVSGKRLLGLWLQIHIASLIAQPPTPTSRFSSLFVPNAAGLGVRARLAEQRFWREVTGVKTSNDDDTAPQPLKLRVGLQVPEGTVVSWDDDLLEKLVSSPELPPLPDDHVVLSVQPPGEEEFVDFAFAELKLAMPRSATERSEMFSNLDRARATVLGTLLSFRYPYEGMPTWLDMKPSPQGTDGTD